MNQLHFGLMSGETLTSPYAAGDVVVKKSGARFFINAIADDGTLICTNVATGLDAIVFAHEVHYRSIK